MAYLNPTYWLWIPSIDRNLTLFGDKCLMDPSLTAMMEPVISQMFGAIDRSAQGFVTFQYLDGTHLCILSDYARENGIETAQAVLMSERKNIDGIELEMGFDRDGLLSIGFSADCPMNPEDADGLVDALLEPIISLYHSHAHPRNGHVIGAYRGTERSDALIWICKAYERYLVEAVSNYRFNSIMPETYFEIRSCALYGRSFLEKYGADIGTEKNDLEYICKYAEETADHTYQSREYRMNHGAAENMASMNNRMFVLMMLSIAMSFFAGSVFNEAIGEMSKSVWAIAGATMFVATGYFGLRYARKRSEKERNALYME